MLKKGLLIILLCAAYFSEAQTINRPAPNSTNTYEFQRYDTTTHNRYYLVAPYAYAQNGPTIPKNLYIIDEDGYIAWWSEYSKRQFDFKYHEDQSQYLFTRKSTVDNNTYHYRMDENFTILDSVTAANGYDGDIHEFQVFPNGNRCIIVTNDTVVDMSSTLINGVAGSANTTVVEIVIQEFDSGGNLVFQWKSLDHVTGDYFGVGLNYNANNFDYLHTNAVDLDSDGNLLLSCRAANMVLKIDHVTGNIIWRLGGHFSDFTFTNDAGFFGQHDARRMPDGRISIYDNDSPNNQKARGTIYSLDTVNMTATLDAETNYSFDFPARSLGSYRVLDNFYSIAGWGNTNRPSPSVTLFDQLGNVASDFLFRDSIVTYRAFFQELPNFPQRPTIDCQENGGNLDLTVNGTHNGYLWSTGETTASISISQPGTYQCWVDQGIGMLGSYEVTYTDINSCSQANLSPIELDDLEIVKYTDLMGKTLNKRPVNQVYFIHYKNGLTERRFDLVE